MAVVPGYCTLCRSRCGTLNTVENDRLLKVEPNPEHPTGRAICPKGRAAPEIVHSPRRLTRPLRRTRPKGDPDPGWEPISWDEALDEISRRLRETRAVHGAEATAFAVTSPSGTPLSDSIEWIERFIRLYGSPNICYATEICNWHKDVAHAFTYGRGIGFSDYANADFIMLWGHNPSKTWLAQAGEIAEARRRGAKLLVVDPRRTGHAAEADFWLPVRPGTDAALALGLAREIIEKNLFDRQFLREWSNAPLLVRSDTGNFLRAQEIGQKAGKFVVWDARERRPRAYDTGKAAGLQGSRHFALSGEMTVETLDGPVSCRPAFQHYLDACAAYTPEEVERITGVPAEQLRETAAALGQARRISYHCWTGVGQQLNATQTDRAIALLYALTGSVDKLGGNRTPVQQPFAPVNDLSLLSAEQGRKALGLQQRPLGPPAQGWILARDLYTAILDEQPYAVRTLVSFGANLLVSHPEGERGAQALQTLDFHVHCDLFENPTAACADILLPVNSPWEREGLRIGFEAGPSGQEQVQLRPAMVPSIGESRADYSIVFDLACRLDMSEAFFGGSLEAGWNYMLAPLGLTVEELRRNPEGIRRPLSAASRSYAQASGEEVGGFATQTRRIEVYSELLARHGYAPVPIHVEAGEASDQNEHFPLVLTCAKNGHFCHSQHRGLASLRRRSPDPVVDLHPDAAEARGIVADSWVRIRTPAGEARFRARLDPALRPEVAVAEYGWWQASPDLGRPGYDPLSDKGSNYNRLLTAEATDPVSGSLPLRALRCEISLDSQETRPWPAGNWRRFKVVERIPETADVASLILEPEDGGRLPAFLPGQHVSVRTLPKADGEPLIRAYSLSSSAGRGESLTGYRISVRHLLPSGTAKEGAMSGHIHRHLRVGDHLELQPPAGSFTLPLAPDRPVVLIAGGIGITPFLSYLETLAQLGSAAEITLLFGNRSEASHPFRTRLKTIQRSLPGLVIENYYSDVAEGSLPAGAIRGQITAADVSEQLMARRPAFYICGPGTMIHDLRQGLIGRGAFPFDIFYEVFRSPPQLRAAGDQQHRVHFARSGRKLIWTADQGSLLSFGEKHGIPLPSGCRVGQCESCSLRILSGEVDHLVPPVAGEEDVCLGCQAIPASDLVVDA